MPCRQRERRWPRRGEAPCPSGGHRAAPRPREPADTAAARSVRAQKSSQSMLKKSAPAGTTFAPQDPAAASRYSAFDTPFHPMLASIIANGRAFIKGNTAQFGGASGSVFSAICGMQISRFPSSKPSEFAFASDEKSIRRPTASFVRCSPSFNRSSGTVFCAWRPFR